MDFLIIALATWRVSHMFAEEDGPFEVFERLRVLCGVEYDEYRQVVADSELAKLILCVWCSSVWFAGIFVILYAIFGSILIWVLMPFALSAAAIMVNGLVNNGKS